MNAFSSEMFLPVSVFTLLSDIRVQTPERIAEATRARRRRTHLAPDGRLNILAADHPARGVTKVGANELAMADRRDLLARILRVLVGKRVDGVMATMDILEELLIFDYLIRQKGGPSFLDGKVLLGSLNRGGLAGACWEMNDPVTGITPEACAQAGLDGGKLLLRIDSDDPASLDTLRACAESITRMNALGLPTFLEPLPMEKTEHGYRVRKEAGPLAAIAGVASALGDSSSRLWLKLPYCEGYEIVARATSLPILLLGGESSGQPLDFLQQVETGLAAGSNVRGALVGRNILYPGEEDPLVPAEAAGAIIHEDASVDAAWKLGLSMAGEQMERITRWLPSC